MYVYTYNTVPELQVTFCYTYCPFTNIKVCSNILSSAVGLLKKNIRFVHNMLNDNHLLSLIFCTGRKPLSDELMIESKLFIFIVTDIRNRKNIDSFCSW